MSQWINEYAILRDLSVAQGRVSVRIEGTVGAGDKPPALNIEEETGEEFYEHCSPDADFTAAPNYRQIQQMLDMVRDQDVYSEEEDICSEKAMVISKHLNPQAAEFTPTQNNTSTPIENFPQQEKTKENLKGQPKKRQRNIAVESILQAIADSQTHNAIPCKQNDFLNQDVILRKPNDFMTSNKTKHDSIENIAPEIFKDLKEVSTGDILAPTVTEKVNGWLETQTESPFPKKAPKVVLENPNINMYKKKTLAKQNVKKLEKSSLSLSANSSDYKPSSLANEYYLKYKEQNKFQESIKDTIWTQAERKMKELDDKRRRVAVQASPSATSHASHFLNQSFEETQSTDAYTARIITEIKISRCLNKVALPQPRHSLTGECIVCQVMTKKPTVPVQTVTFQDDADFIYTIEDDGQVTCTDNKDSTIPTDIGSAKISDSTYNDDENADLNDKNLIDFTDYKDDVSFKDCAELGENKDLVREESVKNTDLMENEFSGDVENVYDCMQETMVPYYDIPLSDRSF